MAENITIIPTKFPTRFQFCDIEPYGFKPSDQNPLKSLSLKIRTTDQILSAKRFQERENNSVEDSRMFTN